MLIHATGYRLNCGKWILQRNQCNRYNDKTISNIYECGYAWIFYIKSYYIKLWYKWLIYYIKTVENFQYLQNTVIFFFSELVFRRYCNVLSFSSRRDNEVNVDLNLLLTRSSILLSLKMIILLFYQYTRIWANFKL